MKNFIAEFIGTMFLVFFGCGTAMYAGCDLQSGGYLITAIAFGLALIIMAYSIGNASGCHINPAVSLAMLIGGRIKFGTFIGYIIAQFAGGIAGAAGLRYLWKYAGFNDATGGLATNALVKNDVIITLIIECVLTFAFVLVVLGATEKPENSSIAGLVIGLSLTLVHIMGIGFTGTSVNPARSLGSAIFAGGTALSTVWVFFAGPLAGALLAALVYRGIIKTRY